jgi:hypothetical protein
MNIKPEEQGPQYRKAEEEELEEQGNKKLLNIEERNDEMS